MTEEVWKDISGFEGLYKVSNLGKVFSCVRNKIMKLDISRAGYHSVRLYKEREYSHPYVHRLVAQAFIPNPDNKEQVDHINTIRTDNNVENLRWVTVTENINNPVTLGKHIGSKRSPETIARQRLAQKTMRPVLCVDTNERFNSLGEAARAKNVFYTNIRKVCEGLRHTAGGLKWEYLQ